MNKIAETTAVALTVEERSVLALESGKAEQALSELAASTKGIVAITNKDGRTECHAAYMTASAARIAIEKAAKEARDDANAFSKAVIAEGKRLVEIIEPEEKRLKDLRDAYDARIKAEKEAKEAAEQARIANIRERIAEFQGKVISAASGTHTASEIEAMIIVLRGVTVDDSFGEFYGDAMEAKGEAIEKLKEIHAQKQATEAEAERLAKERAEVEAARKAEEARQAESRRQLEAERAELDRQRRELEEQQAKAQREAAAEAARNAEKVQEIAPSVMDKIGEAESAGAISPSTAAGLRETVSSIAADAVISKARDCVTTIKLGEICTRLGFDVSAAFLATLGFEPVATEKNAKRYNEASFPGICRRIADHTLRVGMTTAKKAA